MNSNPTPDEVEQLPGVPKFEPYSRQKEAYMDIDCEWTIKLDYTKAYTVTVDDLNSGHIPCRCETDPESCDESSTGLPTLPTKAPMV